MQRMNAFSERPGRLGPAKNLSTRPPPAWLPTKGLIRTERRGGLAANADSPGARRDNRRYHC